MKPELPASISTREEAQRRADRIRAFRGELAELERQGIVSLSADLLERIRAHHEELLGELIRRFDVDRTEAEKGLSLGMRIASFLGAVALSFAVFFFFNRFWGAIPTGAQAALLVAAPILGVVGTEIAARRERTLYVAGIVGLVAVAAFGLTLGMLGEIFNMGASPDPFLAWALFAGVLAYTYGLPVLLVLAAAAFAAFVSGRLGSINGSYWGFFLQKPENLFLPGAIFIAVSVLAPHRSLPLFPRLYRFFGLLLIFVPILVLANVGEASWIDLPSVGVEHFYQLAGFALGAVTLWLGVRRRRPEMVWLSAAFLIVLLFLKFFDWWWEWMPKWLFFLILGAVAVGALLLLRRLQAVTRRVAR